MQPLYIHFPGKRCLCNNINATIKMLDNRIFEQTNNMLRDFSYVDNGVDFKKSITMDAAYCYSVHRGEKYNWARYLIRIFMPLQCVSFVRELNAHKVLFSCWTNRRDYLELISAVQSGISESGSVLIREAFKRKLRWPSLYYIRVFRKGFKCHASLATKVYLSFRLLDYVVACRTMAKEAEKINFDAGHIYVPFNSSFGLENALTQFLNHAGCKTFHLCHGLHFSPNYRFFSIDAFNKELISAQVVLSWGQGFVDNDKKLYNHNYTHEITGNPKYPDKTIAISFHPKSCIVFLARGQYDENNLKLLNVLREYTSRNHLVVSVKPHPTDDIPTLKRLCAQNGFQLIEDKRTIKEVISSSNYGFAVSYETTSYFEAMYYDLICFRFALEENESYGDFDDRFLTADDLSNQIGKYSKMDFNQLSCKVQDLLEYEIGMGINRYSQVLK